MNSLRPSQISNLFVLLSMLLSATRAFTQSAPTVTTGAGVSLRPGQATVSGTVHPNGQATAYWFEHGLTSSYGNFTPTNMLPAGTNAVAVTNLLTSLPRSSTYNFRLVASNSTGLTVGGNSKFGVPAGSNVASSVSGGGQPVDVRQPSLEVNYIICITGGLYPAPGSSVEPPFLGEVRLFAGNFAPNNWAFCHGQLLNIDDYDTLFTIIGTNFGGDGQTTFRLPDLRGRTVMGSGLGPENITRVVGQQGGSNRTTISLTNLALHNHTLPPPDFGGTGSTGDNHAFPNLQPYLVLSPVFWRTGVFPSMEQSTDESMLGQISFFAAGYALNNPPPASGQVLPINQNQAVFSVIGTYYGGNGVTTFALPNLNGRTPMGIGTNWAIGQQAGVVNTTLTASQLPAHQHKATALGIDTGSTGVGEPVSLMKPTLAIRYILCNNGFFPPRSEGAPVPKAIGDSQMLGQINLFAGSFVPAGWLACEGQLLSISKNIQLFSLLGTNFGGDGMTTFALPDLSSRIPVGSSNGVPGAAYGAQQVTLTSGQMPAHSHSVPILDFDRWITSYGLSGSQAGFEGDPDGDGIQNGLEWATGTAPTDANSKSPLMISAIDASVLIRFPRNTNATDLRISLQRTPELTASNTWTVIASNHLGAWLPPTAPVSVSQEGSTNPVSVIIRAPQTNSPAAFYRLRVE